MTRAYEIVQHSHDAHAREDFPQRDERNWLRHTLSWRDDDGSVRLDYRVVHLQAFSNEAAWIPRKEQVYWLAGRTLTPAVAGAMLHGSTLTTGGTDAAVAGNAIARDEHVLAGAHEA